jgi:hypothetical protein
MSAIIKDSSLELVTEALKLNVGSKGYNAVSHAALVAIKNDTDDINRYGPNYDHQHNYGPNDDPVFE